MSFLGVGVNFSEGHGLGGAEETLIGHSTGCDVLFLFHQRNKGSLIARLGYVVGRVVVILEILVIIVLLTSLHLTSITLFSKRKVKILANQANPVTFTWLVVCGDYSVSVG